MRRTLCFLAVSALAWPALSQEDHPLRVQAAVESQRVYVGQPFLLQIQIQGSDQPDAVDIGPLEGEFAVTEAGGGSNSSTSVSIVNGRVQQTVRRGYNVNYRLSARQAGSVQIPSLRVSSQGRTAHTQPIALEVLPPQQNDDFKLRMSLSDRNVYVGQPVVLTVEWYIGRQVQEFGFNMPIFEDDRFEIRDLPTEGPPKGQGQDNRFEFLVGDRRVVADRVSGEIDGRQYGTVLRFQKLLLPRSVADAALPASTVTFQSPRPNQRRRTSVFDDFFGDSFGSSFFGGRVAMETLAIPSNQPRLTVRELPSAGRPKGFNGWIGDFSIVTEAKPAEVGVGEPVTLVVQVEGAELQPTLALPPLDLQDALARDFRVPREIGAGSPHGKELHFTQTLRAKYAGITEIPPVELPYFDPKTGSYRVARSEPIPLEVRATRVVTADDAEGIDSGPRQLEVESSEEGLAHNYVDVTALAPMGSGVVVYLRSFGSPVVAIVLLGLPPLAFLTIATVRLHRTGVGIPRLGFRSAYSSWRKEVAGIRTDSSVEEVAESVIAAVRTYLAARLSGSKPASSSWTFRDAESAIRARADQQGEPLEDALQQLQAVFERCELASYAGAGALDGQGGEGLVDEARKAVDAVEGCLG